MTLLVHIIRKDFLAVLKASHWLTEILFSVTYFKSWASCSSTVTSPRVSREVGTLTVLLSLMLFWLCLPKKPSKQIRSWVLFYNFLSRELIQTFYKYPYFITLSSKENTTAELCGKRLKPNFIMSSKDRIRRNRQKVTAPKHRIYKGMKTRAEQTITRLSYHDSSQNVIL